MSNSSREPYSPVLATDADVTTLWRTIIDPLGWRDATVYATLIGADRRPTPVVLEVVEIHDGVDAEVAQTIVQTYAHLLQKFGPGSLAVLICRPGLAHLTEDDRASCRDVYAAGRSAEVPLEILHVGTDTAIIPVPMDELLPRPA